LLTWIYTTCINWNVTEESYRRALEEAIREYERLSKQRVEIDDRIAQLLQTMGNLSRLCNLEPTVKLGLTDACRLALKAAGHPLTAAEVRTRLEAIGFDVSRYSNPLASIHIVLKRLGRSGEVKFTPGLRGKPAYVWKPPIKVIGLSKSSDLSKLDLWRTKVTHRSPKGE